MAKLITSIFLILFSLPSFSQVFDDTNSLSRRALVLYQRNNNGFYDRLENVEIPYVKNHLRIYGFNEKTRELYITTDSSNCVVKLDKEKAKQYKKKRLSIEALEKAIIKENNELDVAYMGLNETRRFLMTSDSVNNAIKRKNYKTTHDWHRVPINQVKLICSLCDTKIEYIDSLYCIGFRNDTLFHYDRITMPFNMSCPVVHPMKIPRRLKNNSDFALHLEMFGDSLKNAYPSIMNDAEKVNETWMTDAVNKIKKTAPYGFFDDWHWSSEYGFLSFDFKYTNINKNTIKYIDVYWKATNDVNDVRNTGHFKGTGPVKEWDTGRWKWDSSLYIIAGDVTRMDITKVIITYMNGTQKVLSKSMLKFNY